jgi:hypothetical protein
VYPSRLVARHKLLSGTAALLISWQCLSKAYMETSEGQAGVETIQQILRDSNEPHVMIAACEAMNAMDNRDWVTKITVPAIVVGGDATARQRPNRMEMRPVSRASLRLGAFLAQTHAFAATSG